MTFEFLKTNGNRSHLTLIKILTVLQLGIYEKAFSPISPLNENDICRKCIAIFLCV